MIYNMKYLLMIISLAFLCVTTLVANEAVDFTDVVMRGLKTTNVDMKGLNVDEISKVNSVFIKDPTLVAAALHKIYSSAVKQWPEKRDIEKADYITYKWAYFSKKEILSYKRLILNAAENHPVKNVKLFALETMKRAFVEDEEVLFWLIDKLFKPEPEPCLNLLTALGGVAGQKYKHNLIIAIKTCLTSKNLNTKRSTLRYIVFESFYERELLSDFITCYVTTNDSSKVIKLLNLVFKEKYPIEDVVKYYNLINLISLQKNKNDVGRIRRDEFIKWLKQAYIESIKS